VSPETYAITARIAQALLEESVPGDTVTAIQQQIDQDRWTDAMEAICSAVPLLDKPITQRQLNGLKRARGEIYRFLCAHAHRDTARTMIFGALCTCQGAWHARLRPEDFVAGTADLITGNHRLCQEDVNHIFMTASLNRVFKVLEALSEQGYRPSMSILQERSYLSPSSKPETVERFAKLEATFDSGRIASALNRERPTPADRKARDKGGL
jgi:hypothetical protein